jgi:hypothetical protein
MEEGILDVVHQLATDDAFRQELMANPRETLAQRGLSPEVYDTLVRLVPVLVSIAAAGIALKPGPSVHGPGGVGWPRG